MKPTRVLITTAIATAFSLPLLTSAEAGPAAVPKFGHEKCFGISKAAKNDCETANSSCAGTSRRDKQGDAWVYLPKGTCEKLVDGSLQPKKA